MDLAVYTDKKCECGRSYSSLKRIEGRIGDYLVSFKGDLIPLTAIYYESLGKNNAKQFQFCQESKGEVVVQIVKGERYSQKNKEHLLQELQRGVEGRVRFHIKLVNEIPSTKRGKYKLLIQKLPIEFGNH
jgi:phenylacetate-CoA ligase